MAALPWPYEGATPAEGPAFAHAGSNICLDVHGDPLRAQLVVFSDDNHHMALAECRQTFLAEHSSAQDVFYLTTPPRMLVEALNAGGLNVGNLRLAARPHIFIRPPEVLDKLIAAGHLCEYRPFAQSRGSVLLVSKGADVKCPSVSSNGSDNCALARLTERELDSGQNPILVGVVHGNTYYFRHLY